MAKFNTKSTKNRAGVGFTGTIGAEVINHQGGTGFLRDEKSELFLAAVSNFMGDNFYENANDRNDRIVDLVKKVAVNDPVWIQKFASWLRNEGNMRSVAILVALEAADVLIKNGVTGTRSMVSSVLKRADEPGEALGYWRSTKGKALPAAVKRGIADAVVSTYNQYSLPKYDSDNSAYTFADTIRIVHPKPKDHVQEALFKYAIEKRLDSKALPSPFLNKIELRKELLSSDKDDFVKLLSKESGRQLIEDAGLTWEAVAGKAGLSDKIWEALIPNMGYMALLRNLRNFREAGVSASVYKTVLDRLSDPEQVARSKQFPFRFLSAYYANKDHLQTAAALEEALNHSLVNVPVLKGRTLILVDRSGSMFPYGWGRNDDLSNADKAALFGIALALRAENATLVEFGSDSAEVKFRKGDSILPLLNKFHNLGGTQTLSAVRTHYSGHDRVVNLTDEQSGYYGGYHGYSRETPSSFIPADTPYYVFNLNGYRSGEHENGANRYTFGGLTDKCFSLIPLLESGRNCDWPWTTE